MTFLSTVGFLTIFFIGVAILLASVLVRALKHGVSGTPASWHSLATAVLGIAVIIFSLFFVRIVP